MFLEVNWIAVKPLWFESSAKSRARSSEHSKSVARSQGVRDHHPSPPLTALFAYFIACRVTSLVIFSFPLMTVTFTFSPSE